MATTIDRQSTTIVESRVAYLVAVAVNVVLLVGDARRTRQGPGRFRLAGAIVTVLAALPSFVLIGLTGNAAARAGWRPGARSTRAILNRRGHHRNG